MSTLKTIEARQGKVHYSETLLTNTVGHLCGCVWLVRGGVEDVDVEGAVAVAVAVVLLDDADDAVVVLIVV